MNIHTTISTLAICGTGLMALKMILGARKGGKGRPRAIPAGTNGGRRNAREKKPLPAPGEPLPRD